MKNTSSLSPDARRAHLDTATTKSRGTGARPSSGEAMSACVRAPKSSNALSPAELAAPEDGRAPVVVSGRARAWLSRWLFAGLLACAFCSSPSVLASIVTNINIVNFAFSPNTVAINVNDTVMWTWVASDHTTTSTGGLWDSGVNNAGHTFSRIFTSAGSFPFDCTVHPFMTGSINVQSVNVPPSVTITNPPNDSVLASPATFSVGATASDTDGSVTNVLFLQGTNSLGNVQNIPYSVTVHNLAAGDYTLSAVASDNGGAKATNAITIHVVTPSPIALTDAQRPSASSFQFSYSATAGLRYSIQRSADLTQWIALNTNTATGSSETFLDQSATESPGFYRVGLLPNP
jgi:plastocyanin